MSGLVKAVKKVFKKVKKAVKSVLKSDIFKAVAVAAIVWFSVGTASAYFAAPNAGLGAAMSSSASSMWATTTSFFGAEAAATGATQSATTIEGMVAGGEAVANGTSTVAEVMLHDSTFSSGAELAADGLSLASGGGAASSGFAPTITGGANTGMLSAEAGAGMGSSLTGIGAAAPAKTGMMAWLADNPMATMMLGQGVMGAAAGYSADKEATRREELIDDRLEDRGLGGYDAKGNYGGVVSSQQPAVAQTVAEPAVTTPVVQQQRVAGQAAPIVAPQVQRTAVPKDQLPQLLENGQLA